MGIAAFNIGDQTICSAFHKTMYQTNQIMSADELNTYRIEYRHVKKVIIIDEISMVGTRTVNDMYVYFEPRQKLRARLGTHKTGLSLPVF